MALAGLGLRSNLRSSLRSKQGVDKMGLMNGPGAKAFNWFNNNLNPMTAIIRGLEQGRAQNGLPSMFDQAPSGKGFTPQSQRSVFAPPPVVSGPGGALPFAWPADEEEEGGQDLNINVSSGQGGSPLGALANPGGAAGGPLGGAGGGAGGPLQNMGGAMGGLGKAGGNFLSALMGLL